MTTDVDAHDEDDSVATELAISAAVAEALAHPPDPRHMTAEQVESILETVVGVSLRFYAQRVLGLFVLQWKGGAQLEPDAYQLVTESVDHAVRRAIDDTGESVRDIIRVNAEKARASTGGEVFEQSRTDPEVEAYNRLKVGMEGISRILTTRVREEAKWDYATQSGALGKAWRTRRDNRVRTSHGDLEGDFVLVGDPFITINGAQLQRPGDPKAPLYETINCRCRLSYRMPTA